MDFSRIREVFPGECRDSEEQYVIDLEPFDILATRIVPEVEKISAIQHGIYSS